MDAPAPPPRFPHPVQRVPGWRATGAVPGCAARLHQRPWTPRNPPGPARRGWVQRSVHRQRAQRAPPGGALHCASPCGSCRRTQRCDASDAAAATPRLRRTAPGVPDDGARTGLSGRRGCACGAGSRAYGTGAGCSAGRCACSRGCSKTFDDSHRRGEVGVRADLTTGGAAGSGREGSSRFDPCRTRLHGRTDARHNTAGRKRRSNLVSGITRPAVLRRSCPQLRSAVPAPGSVELGILPRVRLRDLPSSPVVLPSIGSANACS